MRQKQVSGAQTVHHSPSTQPRVEWPSANPEFLQIIRTAQSTANNPEFSPPLHARKAATDLLLEEKAKCGHKKIRKPDAALLKLYPYDNPTKAGNALLALQYRGRIQSTILRIFQMLVRRGFLSLETLRLPIDAVEDTEASDGVFNLLCRFDFMEEEMNLPRPFKTWYTAISYDSLGWLAIMIARQGCTDINDLFEEIRKSGYLGQLITDDYQQIISMFGIPKTIKRDPEACLPQDTDTSAEAHEFGFCLPHGLGDVSKREIKADIANRFRKFKE